MRSSAALAFLIGLMTLSLSVPPAHGWREDMYWPGDAAAVCMLNIDGNDPATTRFIKKLIANYADSGIPKFVQENLIFLLSGEVMAAWTKGGGPSRFEYLVMLDTVKDRLEVTLPGKGLKVSINPGNPEKMKGVYSWLFTLLLDELISSEDADLVTAGYGDFKVTFNPEADDNQPFSAYSLVKDRAVIGSSVGIVKRSAQMLASGDGGRDSPLFERYGDRLRSAQIGLIILNDLEGGLSDVLGLAGSEVGRSLDDASKLLDDVVITINGVDEATLKGRAEFLPREGVDPELVSDKVSSLNRALMRDLEGKGLKVETDPGRNERTLLLDFVVSDN